MLWNYFWKLQVFRTKKYETLYTLLHFCQRDKTAKCLMGLFFFINQVAMVSVSNGLLQDHLLKKTVGFTHNIYQAFYIAA